MTQELQWRSNEAADCEDKLDLSWEFLSTSDSETASLLRCDGNENVPQIDANSTQDDTTPCEDATERKPCLNTSRKKLLLLWAPLQLLAIGLVAWTSLKVSTAEATDELDTNENLNFAGMAMHYFIILVVMRDSAFMLTHLWSDSLMGFWNAIKLHLKALPVDFAILLLLCYYSMFKLSSYGAENHCHLLDEVCSKLEDAMLLNIALRLKFICLSTLAKFMLACFFMFCLGGVQMLKDDLEAQERSLQHSCSQQEPTFASENKKMKEQGLAATRECIICLVNYRANDAVTQLKCRPGHFLHSNCLQMAFSKQQESPICREQII